LMVEEIDMISPQRPAEFQIFCTYLRLHILKHRKLKRANLQKEKVYRWKNEVGILHRESGRIIFW